MTARYLVGDVFDRLAEIPDGSVDLVITSPPFLALRSYLPADHPDKGKEIGSEATPAAFLDVMLAVMDELRRVTAPHGSVCIELGDTYAGSSMDGGDQRRLAAGLTRHADGNGGNHSRGEVPGPRQKDGWPLAKSRALIPELFRIALAYGINPLTGQPSPAGKWLVRNVVTWCRPNPPVGALGDKWRPATSDVVVACTSAKRYWDDLATRRAHKWPDMPRTRRKLDGTDAKDAGRHDESVLVNPGIDNHPAGAPLLDYWEVPLLEGEEPRQYGEKKEREDKRHERRDHKLNGPREDEYRGAPDNPAGAPLLDYWEIPPTGYKGAHYAVYPPALVEPLVKAMCPEKVCQTCGEPSRREGVEVEYVNARTGEQVEAESWLTGERNTQGALGKDNGALRRTKNQGSWTDCGHDSYRPGLILDPFAGSGTTLLVATGHGHDAIGIDLDERNAELALERVGPFLLDIEGVVSDANS